MKIPTYLRACCVCHHPRWQWTHQHGSCRDWATFYWRRRRFDLCPTCIRHSMHGFAAMLTTWAHQPPEAWDPKKRETRTP